VKAAKIAEEEALKEERAEQAAKRRAQLLLKQNEIRLRTEQENFAAE